MLQSVNFETVIWVLSMLPLGIFLGCSMVYVFNHMPVAWLCDAD